MENNNLNGDFKNGNVEKAPTQSVSYAEALMKNREVPQHENANNNMIGDLSLQSNDLSDLDNGSSLYETSANDSRFDTACSRLTEEENSNSLYEDNLDISARQKKESLDVSSSSEITLEHFTSEILENLKNGDSTLTSVPDRSFNSTLVSTNAFDDGDNSSELSYGSSSDEESEQNSAIGEQYPKAVQWQFRAVNPQLPETVTVLQAPGGGTVYLVGTAHFSMESQDDVAKTIQATQPDVVLVELCHSRVSILSLDETTLLEETKKINLEKIRIVIQQFGVVQGILHLLLLSMSAHLTKQLGMAPGGEFRKAFTEAKKVPGCVVHLGDRPIQITLRRALATLSWWKKLRIGWYMLTSREPISKQQVEKCKQKDLLEETLAQMTGEFPELSRVFVQERDTYLAYSLQMASSIMPSHVSPSGVTSTVVVGVVGIGHVPGIIEKWGKVSENDIPPIVRVPEASIASKIFFRAVKLSVCGLILYGTFRCGQVVFRNINIPPSWIRW